MDLTVFFAQIWGPVLLLIGAGIFAGPSHYLLVYNDLKREPFATFVFGIFALALGLGHVALHNHWGGFNEVIITLLGWGLLLKGAVFIVSPDVVAMNGRLIGKRRFIYFIATTLIVLGSYLTWIADIV